MKQGTKKEAINRKKQKLTIANHKMYESKTQHYKLKSKIHCKKPTVFAFCKQQS